MELICLGVAPILLNIPNCLTLSATEIFIALYIKNIVAITITAKTNATIPLITIFIPSLVLSPFNNIK